MKLQEDRFIVTKDILREIKRRNPSLAMKITSAIDVGRNVYCINSMKRTFSCGRVAIKMQTTVYMSENGGDIVEIGTLEPPLLMKPIR